MSRSFSERLARLGSYVNSTHNEAFHLVKKSHTLNSLAGFAPSREANETDQ